MIYPSAILNTGPWLAALQTWPVVVVLVEVCASDCVFCDADGLPRRLNEEWGARKQTEALPASRLTPSTIPPHLAKQPEGLAESTHMR